MIVWCGRSARRKCPLFCVVRRVGDIVSLFCSGAGFKFSEMCISWLIVGSSVRLNSK